MERIKFVTNEKYAFNLTNGTITKIDDFSFLVKFNIAGYESKYETKLDTDKTMNFKGSRYEIQER